jgi:hypothetical protein
VPQFYTRGATDREELVLDLPEAAQVIVHRGSWDQSHAGSGSYAVSEGELDGGALRIRHLNAHLTCATERRPWGENLVRQLLAMLIAERVREGWAIAGAGDLSAIVMKPSLLRQRDHMDEIAYIESRDGERAV